MKYLDSIIWMLTVGCLVLIACVDHKKRNSQHNSRRTLIVAVFSGLVFLLLAGALLWE